MSKIDDFLVGEHLLKIYSRLPNKMECRLEGLIIEMGQGMEGKLSEFEDLDFSDMEMSDLKGFDISKKMAINDFLLTNAVLQPKLTESDLDDEDHELNGLFKEIGDKLFERYLDQYSEKNTEKKKVSKLPISGQNLPVKLGL